MNKLLHLFFVLILSITIAKAQIISGPMLGHIELRTAKIWCEVVPGTKIILSFWPINNPKDINNAFLTTHTYMNFETHIFELVALEPGTEYAYQIIINKNVKTQASSGKFTTQELWHWRTPPPDFSFITGSCAYHTETKYDRPGKSYGSDFEIFESMNKENSKFMLWLGDSWYTREVDFGSEWGLWYRASRDRSMKYLQNFLKSMSHYAIWDDHDFGPNNEGLSYIFKAESRKVFMSYFANPSYGYRDEGTYTKVSYNDIDLFLMDNRTWRSSDDMPELIDGKVNVDKKMFGATQMDWLKNALLNSNASFKFIVTGSQVLNETSPYDCMTHYPVEKKEMLDYIHQYKINGVIFITGDRHLSEIIELKREGLYPLYDITVSSLTSGVSKAKDIEINNPMRVANSLIEAHNYARFSFTGKLKDRKLTIEFLDINGKVLNKFETTSKDLKN